MIDLCEVIRVVTRRVEMVVQHLGDPQRRGGYFCLTLRNSLTPLLVVQIGEVRAEKRAKYFELSQEKSRRLASNPTHSSSWQSRNDAADQFPGAICVADYYLSFSGFPSEADEAAMLFVAGDLFPRYMDTVLEIARISHNETFYAVSDIKPFQERQWDNSNEWPPDM